MGSLGSLGTGVYDSDTLAEIDYIPKKMVVQGGGIIGKARPWGLAGGPG